MKKTFIAVLLALTMVAVTARSVFAAPIQIGVVEGLVTGADGNALEGANVSAVCNGNTETTTSASDGFYLVQFGNGVCQAEETVTVTATKDGQSGTNTGVMQDEGDIGRLHLDVGVVNVSVIPEFGLITGGLAMLTSVGSLLFIRKKRSI